MLGPGEYVPDVTEGITRVEDLPKPRIERRSRNYPARRCPRCGHRAGRYAVASRTLHDLGDPRSGRPVDLVVTYSKHHCPHCGCCFAVDLSDLALPKCHVHPPRPATGRPPGGRGRPALPSRQLAPLARPPRLRPLRHHPELGRGGRGKKSWTASRPPTSTRRWLTSPATWPSTRSTTAPSASSRSWTTAGTTAWPSASWTTTRRKTTSALS